MLYRLQKISTKAEDRVELCDLHACICKGRGNPAILGNGMFRRLLQDAEMKQAGLQRSTMVGWELRKRKCVDVSACR
jgi:hypothetical protein